MIFSTSKNHFAKRMKNAIKRLASYLRFLDPKRLMAILEKLRLQNYISSSQNSKIREGDCIVAAVEQSDIVGRSGGESNFSKVFRVVLPPLRAEKPPPIFGVPRKGGLSRGEKLRRTLRLNVSGVPGRKVFLSESVRNKQKVTKKYLSEDERVGMVFVELWSLMALGEFKVTITTKRMVQSWRIVKRLITRHTDK